MEYPDILSCGYTGQEERWPEMFIPELFPALTIIDVLTSLSDFFSNSAWDASLMKQTYSMSIIS